MARFETSRCALPRAASAIQGTKRCSSGGDTAPGREVRRSGVGKEARALSATATRDIQMARTLALARRLARSRTTVLMLGETGVGKEWIARAIHDHGPRARREFVEVNCAALPEALLESELFGHERGAFTGACRSRRGSFEVADGGTLFLDEVAEMAPSLQAKLLRAVQDRRVRRLGSEKCSYLDVRIIAATNRTHDELLAGALRQDLFYRLAVATVRVPPLRERPEDVMLLAERFLAELTEEHGSDIEGFDAEATRALRAHSWPGNVRELRNAVERAALFCDEGLVRASHLALTTGGASGRSLPARGRERIAPHEASSCWREEWLGLPLAEVRRRVLDEIEHEYLREQLRVTGGRVGEVARRAGMTPRSLYDRLQKHGLRKEQFRVARADAEVRFRSRPARCSRPGHAPR